MNNNPFKVPENYFDSLANKIEERIKKSKENTTKVYFLETAKPYIAVAASIAIILSVWYFVSNNNSQSVSGLAVAQETWQNIDTDSLNVRENEVMDYLLAENQLNTENDEINSENITDEAIIEYLGESNIDISGE